MTFLLPTPKSLENSFRLVAAYSLTPTEGSRRGWILTGLKKKKSQTLSFAFSVTSVVAGGSITLECGLGGNVLTEVTWIQRSVSLALQTGSTWRQKETATLQLQSQTVSCLGASVTSWSSVTLGKATLFRSPRFPPSSSLSSPSSSLPPSKLASRCALTSGIGWRRFRLPGSPIMHIKTTKCNRFCLVASVTNQEVFNRSEAQVRTKAAVNYLRNRSFFYYCYYILHNFTNKGHFVFCEGYLLLF